MHSENLQNDFYRRERRILSMRKVRNKLKRGVKIAAAALIVTVSIGGATGFYIYKKQNIPVNASVILDYRYDSIANLRNPDGTPFYSLNIISDDLLSEYQKDSTIEKVKTMDQEALRKLFSVSAGSGSGTANASYCIVCENEELSDEERKAAIEEYAEFYKNWFIDRYYRNENLYSMEPLETAFSDGEVLDEYNILNTRCTALTNYLSSWESKTTGLTDENKSDIRELKEKITAFKTVDLKNFYASTVQGGAYKDKDLSLTVLAYEEMSSWKEYEKQMSYYNIALDCMAQYDSEITDTILIPSVGNDNQFYMSRARTGIDSISDKAKNYLEWGKGSKTEYYTLAGIFEKQNAQSTESGSEVAKELFSRLDGFGEELKELDQKILEEIKPISVEVEE